MQLKMYLKGIVLLIMIFVSASNAQNFNDALRLSQSSLGVSARTVGMGNAFSAVGGAYSSVLFNPAGLGLLNRTEIIGGINYTLTDNQTSFMLSKNNYSNSTTKLNQLGFAYPFPVVRGSLVIAFGYNRVLNFEKVEKFSGFNSNSNSMIQDLALHNDDLAYELGLSYPKYDGAGNYMRDTTLINGGLNQSGNYLDNGGLDNWTLAGAVEIAPNVFAGATLNILSGSYSSNRDYFETDLNDNYSSAVKLDPNDQRTADFQEFYFNDNIKWDISGWELKLGLLYRANSHLRFSAAIKFPTYYTIQESYSVYGESYFANSSFSFDPAYYDKIEYDIKTPFEFSGGVSANFLGLRLAADVKFIDYTQMEFTGGLEGNLEASNNQEIKDIFRGVVNYNLGLEYKIPVIDLFIRSGYMLDKSPYQGDSPEFDKKFYTFGLGYNTAKNVAVDFAIIKGSWNDFTDNYGVNISRIKHKYDYKNYIFSLRYYL